METTRNGPLHLQFETNLDELVDAHVRFQWGTPWARRQRLKLMLLWSAIFAASLGYICIQAFRIGPFKTAVTITGLAVLATVVFALAFLWLYNWSLPRSIRSSLAGQYGLSGSWTFEIELRPDGAWTRSRGLEMTFLWPQARGVEDLDAGVLLRFQSGLILVRTRAFASPDVRRAFVETARAAQPA